MKPRWIGGPQHCERCNLPSFTTDKKLKAFFTSICVDPGVMWLCNACMRWHSWPKPKALNRRYHIPQRILTLIQKTKVTL